MQPTHAHYVYVQPELACWTTAMLIGTNWYAQMKRLQPVENTADHLVSGA